MDRDPNEIGALWLKKSAKGTSFLSGKIDGRPVVVFKNKNKKADKQPDYRVLLSQPREKREENPPPREAGDDFGA